MPVEGVGEDGTGVHEGDSMPSRDPSSARACVFSVVVFGRSVSSRVVCKTICLDSMDGYPSIRCTMDADARAMRRSRARRRGRGRVDARTRMGGAFGTRGRRGRAFGTVVMTTMMFLIRVASATTWIPLPMDDDRFRVVRSYAPPEYAVDADGRARFRGWFASSTTLDAGDDALATPVPRDARPTREETWRVTLKGHERTLTMTREGRLIVGDSYEADTWFALTGLEYDTAAAFEEAETAPPTREDEDAGDGACAAR